MRIVFLGTGGTYPSRLRNVTSVAVQMLGQVLLFDCGEGTQRQLMRSPVSFMKIDRIFISHLHADHFLGLPGLIQSMSLNDRKQDLMVYGPNGLSHNVDSMMSLGYFESRFRVRAVDLEPGAKLDFGSYSVRCVSADHSIPALAYALEEAARPGRFGLRKAKALGIPEGPLFRRLQEGGTVVVGRRRITPGMVLGRPRPGRKVVYSGDTKPSAKVTALAKGADVLIHDCTLDSSHDRLAAEFGHSTAAQAATVAKKAGVRMLYLVHVSPRYEDGGLLEKEARRVFKRSVVAQDLSEYAVRYAD